MSRARLFFLCALTFCTAGFAIAASYLQLKQSSKPPLQHIKTLPDFSLTERSGKTVRLADLKGKVWLADFVYTTCPGPCRTITRNMSELQNAMQQFPDVRLVSISTDPAHDSPQVLRDYAENFHASSEKWLFLTGEKSKVYDLIEHGFLLPIAEQRDAEQPILHSTKIMLVDKNGVIRAFYDGAELTPNSANSDAATPASREQTTAAIVNDVRRLLRE